MSALSSFSNPDALDGDAMPQRLSEPEVPTEQERATPITIATIAGTTELKLRIKKDEMAPGPMVNEILPVIHRS